MTNPDFLKIILNLMGGVVIFLYGLELVTDTLSKMAENKLKDIITRFTTNVFTSILLGAVVTAVMGSSTLVVTLTIALVNAKILNLRQALGIVMGSNIGTTMVTQLIVFKVADYATIVLFIGFMRLNFATKDTHKYWGNLLMGAGFVFFGLEYMQDSVASLRTYKPFTNLMLHLENPILGVLIGAFFTVITQASAATVALAISLAHQELIGLPVGIALMMGAEIGTSSNTLLATIGRNRQAIRTGVFHLFFNVISVVLGILLVYPFTQFVHWVSGEATVSRKIANAHLFFNMWGVVLFAGFTLWIVHWLEWLIPDKKDNTNN